jgi:uncharacterized protein Yka (UPF0111/DUF47 family)
MALNLFSRLMPRQENFTDLFCEQTRSIVAAAQELQRIVEGDGANESHVAAIRSFEAEADAIAKKVFVAANRTFNAPIDREDILGLAHDLDDAVDLIEDTAKGIQRYELREFSPEMRAMAEAVVRSARVLEEVMPLLDAITPRHQTIFALCEKIGQIEGEADEYFDAGHGGNDAQKTMGIIAVLLYSQGLLGAEFHVPFWVVLSCQAAMGLGTLLGGWKIVHTMGSRITQLKPIQGFCAETAGATTLFLATGLGVPVSTTHTITGSIIGVGAAHRTAAVRWHVAGDIVAAWIFTIPAAAIIGATAYWMAGML